MGGACGTCGEKENFMQNFGWGHLKERRYVEDLDVDGRLILKQILKERLVGMHWISVFQDGDKRRSFVKKAMNSGIIKGGEFFDQLKNQCYPRGTVLRGVANQLVS